MKNILWLFIIPAFLWSTVYKQTSIEKLIETSPIILEGVILSKTAYWLEGMIVTDITVAVSESFKGESGPDITFRIPGGRVADKELTIHGMPDMEIGDVTLLFLVSHNGIKKLNSMSMGFFRTDNKIKTSTEKTYYNPVLSDKILISVSTDKKYPQKPVIKKSSLIKKIQSGNE
jgi:hypothetical protein